MNPPYRTKLGKKSNYPVFRQIIDLIPILLLRKATFQYQTNKHFRPFRYPDSGMSYTIQSVRLYGECNADKSSQGEKTWGVAT